MWDATPWTELSGRSMLRPPPRQVISLMRCLKASIALGGDLEGVNRILYRRKWKIAPATRKGRTGRRAIGFTEEALSGMPTQGPSYTTIDISSTESLRIVGIY